MSFASITNRNEYFSDHYLDSLLAADLQGVRSDWNDREQRAEPTPRTALRSLRRRFEAAKADVTKTDADTQPERHRAALHELHDSVLDALGFAPQRETITLERAGGAQLEVPIAHQVTTSTGLHLIAIEASYAADLDDAIAEENDKLLEPATVDGKPQRQASDVVALGFAATEPPRYVLLLHGGVVVLADRNKWAEGRFLAVDLDVALGVYDTKPKGEIETIAGLFSADALVPHDGQTLLDTLTDQSHKHAVGVSKDLREGIRKSVELLANEVVRRRLEAHLRVYDEPDLARDLTRQCLRFMYRILFLLFAEARPELGILPVDAPEYHEGYGLDRLRDLALVELHTDAARNGRHLHDSLDLLFGLVNDGHHAETAQRALLLTSELVDAASDDVGLAFRPLHSQLFGPAGTPFIDRIRLGNQVLQEVLQLLLLSKERRARDRGFVSYSQLGINQLGAVYEGLMAYSGFFADVDLYEVSKPGQHDKGTWVLPVTDADTYSDDVFVSETEPQTGASRRVLHPKGSFVYRLSGRARQRSASYYTPEVLTRCVVKHALAELLDQDGEITPASAILDFTICEPALGSGAFLNEAINQLASEYLRRRQLELDEQIDPDRYPVELQRVKASIALHQCYGVDLNPTAVELAEVSLWLNCMYPDLQAPWFGLHLKRGNSLVGARRATYRSRDLKGGHWLKKPPVDRNLSAGAVEADEIHHFLLPAAGWGAVADAPQAKQLKPAEAKRLRDWRKSMTKAPTAMQQKRLLGLARRAENLWGLALNRLELAERRLHRPIPVYGQEAVAGSVASPDEIRQLLFGGILDPVARLRWVMDAWCAMWFWPIVESVETPGPPTLEEWLTALEGILGIDDSGMPLRQLDLFEDLDTLTKSEEQVLLDFSMKPINEVVALSPWLRVARATADREGFFHWELDFATPLRRGGFDLQVGNPPWVRPTWNEDDVLAEEQAWFGLSLSTDVAEVSQRRLTLLANEGTATSYLAEVGSFSGLTSFLGSTTCYALLVGVQTNLYMAFMTHTWRIGATTGCVGLLHPEGHFSEARGEALRRSAYRRLRRHWHFVNEASLFPDVGHTRPFGIHIYGSDRAPAFLLATHLQLPSTLDESFEHDGTGPPPGIKLPDGGWDRTPHRARIFAVDAEVLNVFGAIEGQPPEIDGGSPRLLLPLLGAELDVLRVLSRPKQRIRDAAPRFWTGLREGDSLREGSLIRQTRRPDSWTGCVLQNPHLDVATLFASEPREVCRSSHDYDVVDLERIERSFLPRTNFQIGANADLAFAQIERALGSEWSVRPRMVHRRRVDSDAVRSLRVAIAPPGTLHVDTMNSIVVGDDDLAFLAGLLSTLPFEYALKMSGRDDYREEWIARLPMPEAVPGEVRRAIELRALRLNCVTEAYADLWSSRFSNLWCHDTWVLDGLAPVIGDVASEWSESVPLRSARVRRAALVELDALAAIALDLSPADLSAMYRTQFPVLRKNEDRMLFDAAGLQIAADRYAYGVRQEKGDWERVNQWLADPGSVDLGVYSPPFFKPDREKEMRAAYEEFERRPSAGT